MMTNADPAIAYQLPPEAWTPLPCTGRALRADAQYARYFGRHGETKRKRASNGNRDEAVTRAAAANAGAKSGESLKRLTRVLEALRDPALWSFGERDLVTREPVHVEGKAGLQLLVRCRCADAVEAWVPAGPWVDRKASVPRTCGGKYHRRTYDFARGKVAHG